MLGAREGETRLIVIPSELGYGELGQGSIPGGAVLVFRVTVNEIELPEG
jgi:FKBP-type peptidyl-prolyl cis-trans isomerase